MCTIDNCENLIEMLLRRKRTLPGMSRPPRHRESHG
jgi:hypothetical protein